MRRDEDEYPVLPPCPCNQRVERRPDGHSRRMFIEKRNDVLLREADLLKGGRDALCVVDGVVEARIAPDGAQDAVFDVIEAEGHTPDV